MMEYISFEERPLFRDLSLGFLSLVPAFTAGILIYLMGSSVYIPVSMVLLNYYFAPGVGWLASPVIWLSSGLSPLPLLGLVVFLAFQGSLFVTVNYDLLERIPLLGRIVRRIRIKAEQVIEKKTLVKDISYIGLFWLTFLPIYGTGPMTMSFIGRILSLEWWKVWVTVCLSSFVRYSLVIALIYYGFF